MDGYVSNKNEDVVEGIAHLTPDLWAGSEEVAVSEEE